MQPIRQLDVASSPPPNLLCQLTATKWLQDNSTWRFLHRDNSLQAARGKSRWANKWWAEHRAVAAASHFHTHCGHHCHCYCGLFGSVKHIKAMHMVLMTGWMVSRWQRPGTFHFHTQATTAELPTGAVAVAAVRNVNMGCTQALPPPCCPHHPLQSLNGLNAIAAAKWLAAVEAVEGVKMGYAQLPPLLVLCSPTQVFLYLPTASCPHSQLAVLSYFTMAWPQWVGRGDLAMASWLPRVILGP